MKYHALLVIFEKAAKFEIVVCCKLYMALYGLSMVMVNLPVIHSQPDVLGLVLGGDTAVFITQVDLLSGRARDAECHVCCSQLFLVHFLDTHQT